MTVKQCPLRRRGSRTIRWKVSPTNTPKETPTRSARCRNNHPCRTCFFAEITNLPGTQQRRCSFTRRRTSLSNTRQIGGIRFRRSFRIKRSCSIPCIKIRTQQSLARRACTATRTNRLRSRPSAVLITGTTQLCWQPS